MYRADRSRGVGERVGGRAESEDGGRSGPAALRGGSRESGAAGGGRGRGRRQLRTRGGRPSEKVTVCAMGAESVVAVKAESCALGLRCDGLGRLAECPLRAVPRWKLGWAGGTRRGVSQRGPRAADRTRLRGELMGAVTVLPVSSSTRHVVGPQQTCRMWRGSIPEVRHQTKPKGCHVISMSCSCPLNMTPKHRRALRPAALWSRNERTAG